MRPAQDNSDDVGHVLESSVIALSVSSLSPDMFSDDLSTPGLSLRVHSIGQSRFSGSRSGPAATPHDYLQFSPYLHSAPRASTTTDVRLRDRN